MNSLNRESATQNARRIRAEAAVWIARKHRSDWNAVDEAVLNDWLAEDPAHAVEFQLATDVWDAPGSVPLPPPRRPILRPVLALTAVLVLAIACVVAYFMPSDLVTRVGERRTVTLADGTRVELNTNTRIRVLYNAHQRKVALNSGEAYFNVSKHEPRPFIVVAGDRKIIATGTSFTVYRDDSSGKQLTVTLIEGRVAVAPLHTPDSLQWGSTPDVTMLIAGERAKFRNLPPPVVDNPPLGRVTSWRDGRLSFVDTPLGEAVAEFNRYNVRQITVRSPEATTIHVNGVFRVEDASSFITTVAEANHLALRPREGELILESTRTDRSLERKITPN
jgi:transmembrane sensor